MGDRPLWPHQASGIREVLAHIARGVRRITLTSPTGGGKSTMIATLIKLFQCERDWSSIVYTNRKLLIEQLTGSLRDAGIVLGVRAAGHAEQFHLPVQVSSVQTENSRVYRRQGYKKWELHPAHVVFVDEAHLQNNDTALKIVNDHLARGATVIWVTATPLDMGGLSDALVVAGNNTQCREAGALVPAIHYGCDEPDLRHIGRAEADVGDLSEPEQQSLMGRVEADGKPQLKLQKLFGRVFDWFEKLNPDHKPSILFAPGVPESLWFAQEFTRIGIPAGHIDGKDIWVPGAGEVKTSKAARAELLEMSKDGTVKILCNRFVLREGIDCPWLAHGVFATPFGSLQSYLQSGGRLLRAFRGLEHVTVQDHGGCWWKHGSLNADREWTLDCTSRMVAGVREDRLREKKDNEPFRCPQCAAIMASLKCICGFKMDPYEKTRPVVMEDGRLVMMEGDIFRPRTTEMRRDTQKLWTSAYFAARNGDKTFREAIGWFYQKHGYFPPAGLKGMPKLKADEWRKVKELKPAELIQ